MKPLPVTLTTRLISLAVLLTLSAACSSTPAVTASPATATTQVLIEYSPTDTPLPATATSTIAPTTAATMTPAATATQAPSPTPTLATNTNPFTGLPIDPAIMGRIPLLVKVSNSSEARPQTGLSLADVVVEHYSEGGITRFTALFHTNSPEKVGSVRSCRLVDIELPVIFGSGIVCSGTSGGVRLEIKASKSWQGSGGDVRKTVWMVSDLGVFECGGQRGCKLPMFRTADAYKPHNLFANPLNAWAELTARGVNKPTTFNTWAFSNSLIGGRAAMTVSIPYTSGVVGWKYDAATGLWARSMSGRAHVDKLTGKQITAANVLVVYVNHVKTLIQEDAGGSRSIQVQLWGDGPAKVFRDGKMIEGFWRRAGNAVGFSLVDKSGNVIPFRPGATWIQLAPLNMAVKQS